MRGRGVRPAAHVTAPKEGRCFRGRKGGEGVRPAAQVTAPKKGRGFRGRKGGRGGAWTPGILTALEKLIFYGP